MALARAFSIQARIRANRAVDLFPGGDVPLRYSRCLLASRADPERCTASFLGDVLAGTSLVDFARQIAEPPGSILESA